MAIGAPLLAILSTCRSHMRTRAAAYVMLGLSCATLAAAMNHSVFNFANAAGAFLGGVAIDAGLGYAATG